MKMAVIITPFVFKGVSFIVGSDFVHCVFVFTLTLTQAGCSLSCLVFTEVTLKIHLSDASTHQPLFGATVQLFSNHSFVTTETSSADGNAYLHFSYRLGIPLVVTATKQGYVPNSVPWTPSRLPGKCICDQGCVIPFKISTNM